MADKIATVQDAMDFGLSTSLPSNKCLTVTELAEMIGDSKTLKIQECDIIVCNHTVNILTIRLDNFDRYYIINALSVTSIMEHLNGEQMNISLLSTPNFNWCFVSGIEDTYERDSRYQNNSGLFGTYIKLESFNYSPWRAKYVIQVV